MSAPRTNAAIADDLERWFREVHETLPPTPARHAIEALRKDSPATVGPESGSSWVDAIESDAALPAEVEAVLARLDSLIVTISDSEGESVHVPMVCLQAATLLRRYAQAVAEKDAEIARLTERIDTRSLSDLQRISDLNHAQKKLQAVEALCVEANRGVEPGACPTHAAIDPDVILAILREEH